MQFVLLIYQGTTPFPNTDEWAALSSEEQKAIYADYAAVNKTPGISSGPPLGLPADAKTVRVDPLEDTMLASLAVTRGGNANCALPKASPRHSALLVHRWRACSRS